jgi:hypothetical protein
VAQSNTMLGCHNIKIILVSAIFLPHLTLLECRENGTHPYGSRMLLVGCDLSGVN